MIKLNENIIIFFTRFRYANKIVLFAVFFLSPVIMLAQVPLVPSSTVEQQLESITESNDDNVTEDDSFLQNLSQLLKEPLNLNFATTTDLKELGILSPLQIENIIAYRNLLGGFISIYELQTVPGWDIATIQRLRPYITVSTNAKIINSFGDRLKGGVNTILVGAGQVFEKSKGYKLNATTANNFYPGSPQRVSIRYLYQFKNLLQFGVVAEKDAGEEFFRGTQKQGFDFYSAHLFARNIGIIKLLAVGNFTVNMGQGLVQWQNLAFKKSADVMNIKRQLAILRPYNSTGEINFHRGVGITLAKNYLQATFFATYRKVDANFIADTINNEDYISSLQSSGLHRTKSETDDKGVQKQVVFGGNIGYTNSNWHIGLNAVQYYFQFPVNKSVDPYNIYALSGKKFGNYSLDFSYTFKNLHFFGEAATTQNFNTAFINGLMISADTKADISIVYRNISKKYQSLYTNAFTENTLPSNEKGLYLGLSLHPASSWRINAFADFYKFPWLKYLVDGPSGGVNYLVMTTFKPNKVLEVYVLYRFETKAKNYSPFQLTITPLANRPWQNVRAQIIYSINSTVTFRNRIEFIWFDAKGTARQNGFLSYADLIYSPIQKKYSGNIRVQYFNTDSYDSRMYAYENDVLYNYSIPVFYEQGFRYYVNLNYKLNKKMAVWLKWSQSIYANKKTIGTGIDEIEGNKRTGIALLFQYQF
jgi:hypothetical protein